MSDAVVGAVLEVRRRHPTWGPKKICEVLWTRHPEVNWPVESTVGVLLDRAGLVGGDGAVHHGFCDIAILRTLPGAAITAAIDEPSLRAALDFMRLYEDGLSSVRYPRDTVSARLADQACPPFVLGRARCLTA